MVTQTKKWMTGVIPGASQEFVSCQYPNDNMHTSNITTYLLDTVLVIAVVKQTWEECQGEIIEDGHAILIKIKPSIPNFVQTGLKTWVSAANCGADAWDACFLKVTEGQTFTHTLATPVRICNPLQVVEKKETHVLLTARRLDVYNPVIKLF